MRADCSPSSHRRNNKFSQTKVIGHEQGRNSKARFRLDVEEITVCIGVGAGCLERIGCLQQCGNHHQHRGDRYSSTGAACVSSFQFASSHNRMCSQLVGILENWRRPRPSEDRVGDCDDRSVVGPAGQSIFRRFLLSRLLVRRIRNGGISGRAWAPNALGARSQR